jgi:ABC-type lipoprotein release transport system permease subunit
MNAMETDGRMHIGFLLRISLRNLLRQKRRNLMLGAAMAIGMALLLIANAFSHGISDVMFNRILNYAAGHLSIGFSVRGNQASAVFHDGPGIRERIRAALPPGARVDEAIGQFCRMVGDGVSDNVILIGMDIAANMTEKEAADLRENFSMLDGSFEEITRTDIENSVIMAADKAKYLRVKRGDVVRARFQDIYGRNQAARLTVAGIFKPANIFMSAPVFTDLKRLRVLAGYGPDDVGGMRVTLEDPKRNAVPTADALHAALSPPLAAAFGAVAASNAVAASGAAPSMPVTVLGFRTDTASLARLAAVLGLPGESAPGAKSVLAGRKWADSLGLSAGSRCVLSYRARHGGGPARAEFKVTGILPGVPGMPDNVLLVNDKDFYGFYYGEWPEAPGAGAFLPDSAHPLWPLLDKEWILLDRTHTTEEMEAKYREATKLKTRATLVDVPTMYESASMIVKLESALNLITLSAVLILLFIIQVGVVNTLRMTIRERTREIGTMRAIGMQKGEVRAQFLLETFFLAVAACIGGVILAYIGMGLLKLITFQSTGNPLAMLLVSGHLNFKPTLIGGSLYVMLIVAIAVATAWFPSRRAANLRPSEALRHFG